MYKVFIENKPIIFQINSQKKGQTDHQRCWDTINQFISSTQPKLDLEIGEERDFQILFEKHKKIEAAGGIVQNEKGFLFIKRHGLWDIPKGKLEKGESPEIGAVREIEEECGLIAPIIKQTLCTTYHTYSHKGEEVLKLTFWFWLKEGKIKSKLVPQGEEGITEVGYFEQTEFDKIKSKTYLSIIEVIEHLEKFI